MTNMVQEWHLPVSPVLLLQDQVHLWRASLEVSPSTLQTLFTALSKDERERAARFRFSRDQQHFIVAHGILRKLLACYLQIDTSSLFFVKNAYGKPALDPAFHSADLHFNLSHSQDIALFAFSYRRELGVDVEYMRKEVEYDQLARFCFSAYEQQILSSLVGSMKEEAFFNCWTRKEAYIKARGLGLSLPLALFDVSLLPLEPARLLESRESPDEVSRWSFCALVPGMGYAGALVVEGHDWLLHTWDWSLVSE